jgi:Mlc titration factor MtfA (ptsG expression regulator)
MFSWLRNHRRSELRAAPFPPEWKEYLRLHVAHYDWLTSAEQERLQGDIQIFIAEKEWEGARGFEVRDEVKLVIAAQACLLLLGWEDPHYFPNVSTIIVYPAGFRSKSRQRDGYIETEKQHSVLGEAWSGNLPVIVSWDDARDGSVDPEMGTT